MTIKNIFAKEVNLSEMLTNSDFVSTAGLLINEYLMNLSEVPTFDQLWKELFYNDSTDKEVETFPGKAKLAFTWKAMGPGEQPVFASMSDVDNVVMHLIKYRAAAAFDSDIIKYNKKMQFQRAMDELKRSAGEFLATLHYGAINTAAGAGTGATNNSPQAIGYKLNTDVATMVNAGNVPTAVVCNISDEPLIKTAIDRNLYQAYLERNMDTTNSTKLSDTTYALKVIPTRYIIAGNAILVEAKRGLISLYDSADGELKLEDEKILLTDSQNVYGKVRRAVWVNAASVKKTTF